MVNIIFFLCNCNTQGSDCVGQPFVSDLGICLVYTLYIFTRFQNYTPNYVRTLPPKRWLAGDNVPNEKYLHSPLLHLYKVSNKSGKADDERQNIFSILLNGDLRRCSGCPPLYATFFFF